MRIIAKNIVVSPEGKERTRLALKAHIKTEKQRESAASVWRGKKIPEYIIKAFKDANSIKIINIETGKIFDSMIDAANFEGVGITGFRNRLIWAKSEKYKFLDEKLNLMAEEATKNRTIAQKRRNLKNIPTKTSKFRGVGFNKEKKKWEAQIRIDGKKTFLGRFLTELEASKAYEKAVEEIKQKIIDNEN